MGIELIMKIMHVKNTTIKNSIFCDQQYDTFGFMIKF